MKHGTTLIILAVSLIITCLLLGIMLTMYKSTNTTWLSQQNALQSMQSEYEDADVISLQGKTVTPTEAMTLVRKYYDELNIKINGAIPGGSITKSNFGGSSVWRIQVETARNGASSTINFVSINRDDNSIPTSLDDAVAKLGEKLGLDNAGWSSIFNAIDSARESIDYKARIAGLIGSNDDGTWGDVYTDLVETVTETDDATATVPYEKITVNAGETVGYTLYAPARGVAVSGSESAALVFVAGSCSIRGNLTGLSISLASSEFTNSGDDTIVVYLYSE